MRASDSPLANGIHGGITISSKNLARNCNLGEPPADFEAEMSDWHERCEFHQCAAAVEYAAADRSHCRLRLCAPEWPAATEETAANPSGRRPNDDTNRPCASLEKMSPMYATDRRTTASTGR
ncbi:hypothetical protein M9Y10_040233 [Tritrichomonas musculus]|uniref:Uncharacterized protein n=1 Tax=Tritrichomonas musculus TaxID=1915356 RepID=A0ABR2GQ19_9EUKA